MNAHNSKHELAFKLPAMMSYHATWDDADYEPVIPVRRHRSWLRARFTWAREAIARYRERQGVRAELASMTDRELADIGMSRYDISRVFDPEFAREHASRGF
jgi:uncharacterized protein YjiS (DUF1127 family)